MHELCQRCRPATRLPPVTAGDCRLVPNISQKLGGLSGCYRYAIGVARLPLPFLGLKITQLEGGCSRSPAMSGCALLSSLPPYICLRSVFFLSFRPYSCLCCCCRRLRLALGACPQHLAWLPDSLPCSRCPRLPPAAQPSPQDLHRRLRFHQDPGMATTIFQFHHMWTTFGFYWRIANSF